MSLLEAAMRHVLLALVACALALSDSSAAEQGPIVFPADAVVVNVKDAGVKGDGVSDDTAALNAVFKKYCGTMGIIYIPAGTYLVSGPLGGDGTFMRWTYIQGAGRDLTIFKLKDRSPGYQDPGSPLWLFMTSPDKAPCACFVGKDKGCNIAFDIQINDLTLDTGSGNPGAIGMHYLCNNTGGIKNVTIRSGDGQGVTGLDMKHYGQGPSLVKGVTVIGFDCGLWTKRERYQNVFEDIRLENQRVVGLRNTGLPITVRKLHSRNKVPAVINQVQESATDKIKWEGQIVLIDAVLEGGDPAAVAIVNHSSMYLRNCIAKGYKALLENKGALVEGSVIKEWFSDEWQTLFPTAKRSLGLPVKETPDLPYEPLTSWESVGAHADKVVNDDWGPAIQAAIDSGKSTVYFPKGIGSKDAKGKLIGYTIRTPVIVRGAVRVMQGCGNAIKADDQALAGKPAIRIEAGKPDTVFFEKFTFEGKGTHIEQAARILVVQQSRWLRTANAAGCGDLFVDCWGGTGIFTVPQQVFVRSLNMEASSDEPMLVNAAADIWILGLKTEGSSTNLHNKAKGRVEILGGLLYPANKDPRVGRLPGFINEGGAFSLITCTLWAHKNAVQDTVGGTTKTQADSGRYWNYVYLPGTKP